MHFCFSTLLLRSTCIFFKKNNSLFLQNKPHPIYIGGSLLAFLFRAFFVCNKKKMQPLYKTHIYIYIYGGEAHASLFFCKKKPEGDGREQNA